MPKSDVYVCPRCGYEAQLKKHMKKHLFELKKPCPNRNNLELTESIKHNVLDCHFYFPPKPEMPAQVTYNNHNQTVNNNFVNNLDTFTKLEQFLSYNKKPITDINDFVENQYKLIVDKLENDEYKYLYLIDSEKFLTCIDNMVKINGKNHEEMNVVYDEMLDRIRIYCDDGWENHMIEAGLKRIIDILRTNYLDQYECYLYRKLFLNRVRNGHELTDLNVKLEEYYKFLYTFDRRPYVYNQENDYVLPDYNSSDPNEFMDFGMKIYEKIRKELTKSEISHTKKMVLDIVKRNHKVNLKKLNESIIELINIDDDFKNNILKSKMFIE